MEVLLAVTVFGMFVTALVGVIVFGRTSTASAGYNERATFLAQEALEAVRNIRDENLSNISDGTYGLVQSGGVWTLSGSSDVTDVYTRSITISSVDAYRKNITANVTWPYQSSTGNVSLRQLLTGWGTITKTWANATKAGSYDIAGTNDALKVAASGNYAYVVRASGSPNFAIFDISNAAAPVLVGSLSTVATNVTNIFVSGNYAYVTTSSNSAEMQIINISNPASPSIAGTYNATGNSDGLAVYAVGNYAYLARAANGNSQEFVVVNVSNPATPTTVGSYNNNSSMTDVVVDGNYAYIGTNASTQEVMLINISNPAAPSLATTYDLPGNVGVNAIAKNGNNLYVASGTVLQSVGVGNPLSPVNLGSVTSAGVATINDITIDTTSNNYAFLGTNYVSGEFQVVDISNPASMSVVRTVDIATSGASSNVNGVAYNVSLDVVAGAGASDTEELMVFTKN